MSSEPSPFVPALLELRNAGVNVVIEKLHLMFTGVSKMNLDEACASFQTIEALAKVNNALAKDPAVLAIANACISQMVAYALHPQDMRRVHNITQKYNGYSSSLEHFHHAKVQSF
jgi:hypothetical protein